MAQLSQNVPTHNLIMAQLSQNVATFWRGKLRKMLKVAEVARNRKSFGSCESRKSCDTANTPTILCCALDCNPLSVSGGFCY